MISFIVGTTAELIKIAPVHHALVARGATPQLWFTAQHVDEVPDTLEDLGLSKPDVWLVPERTARNLERPAQVPGWAASVARSVAGRRKELRAALESDGKPGVVVVHGDTFTTPYGSLIGRILGARVAHVEAGTRSGSLLSPLPEEANRRIAARMVDIHFAPTPREVRNLRRARGVVVDTGANTVIDALRLAKEGGRAPYDLPAEFGLVTLHRFELLQRPEKFREVLQVLKRASEKTPLLYLVGAHERERLDALDLNGLFDDERFVLRPKLRYLEFLPLLTRAKFVVTDSGGLQEEGAYLGMPCAIHRERTERHQGLGQNIVLTGMRADKLEKFLVEHETLRRPSMMDQYHPSEVIADTLDRLGYV
ncbi:UDP-N-acetylglucosamine 2-epimerase [Saccharothrix longispora]|uniref:UDP-N-acetylglucosamine 2-epimerase (Non-hydrolyzing) n=1 Tax=Saccharothrix longispora TaxID=33920 RepID=A0ABU1Q3R0_9PSEU|nr:UDP-N-acetylglucosamine 2-epimerase [Saccharothrix longispora]MDR6597532.1 UDP-N-acetylglucosamine 2-epimerase (non-hydrolyzing) [Saccharothrix longispora]